MDLEWGQKDRKA